MSQQPMVVQAQVVQGGGYGGAPQQMMMLSQVSLFIHFQFCTRTLQNITN
jgi:hypothetical protein